MVMLIMVCFGCKEKVNIKSNDLAKVAITRNSEPLKKVQPPKMEIRALAGNWIRTDRPHKLNLIEFAGDGTLKAEYLNPKPAHIGKASWLDDNSFLNIYLELRDEKFPGSTYTLFYIPNKDLLVGKFFHAKDGATYNVGFKREK